MSICFAGLDWASQTHAVCVIDEHASTRAQFEIKHDLTRRLAESLPWPLTKDQKIAIREITADMTSPERMHRLLMGDVGTGKTVVALFAMLLAVENDFQAALMAPTELLAEQHAATLTALLEPLAIRPLLLLGRQHWIRQLQQHGLRYALTASRAFHAIGDERANLWVQEVEEQQPFVVPLHSRPQRNHFGCGVSELRGQLGSKCLLAVLE